MSEVIARVGGQDVLAGALGLSQSVISKYKRGETYPVADAVVGMYLLTGARPDWLLLGLGEPPSAGRFDKHILLKAVLLIAEVLRDAAATLGRKIDSAGYAKSVILVYEKLAAGEKVTTNRVLTVLKAA